MSPDPAQGPILLLLLLMILYGLLAAADEALRNLNPGRLRIEDGQDAPDALQKLAEDHAGEATGIRVGITLNALLIGALIAYSLLPRTARWLTGLGLPAGTLLNVATVTLLCFLVMLLLRSLCGAIPRKIAEAAPEKTALKLMPLIRALSLLFRPCIRLIDGISGLFLRGMGSQDTEEVTEEDIRALVDMGSESGALEENEKEMIDNIFKFSDHIAEDVMTHRTDVAAIWVGDDDRTIIRTILETGLSRFPVYDRDMDDIIGILSTRDYLLNSHRDNPRPLKTLLREAYFVPETVPADTLFRDMQKRKVHMAMVVDEYGGLSGIVTMEDLLEEIVGNIYDEFDLQTESDIVRLGDNLWRISGATPLEDVSEALEVALPTDEDYDTLGGLIFDQLTTIPQDGSHPEMDILDLHIRVERLAEHRVETALVSKRIPPAASGEPKPAETPAP